MTSKSKIAATLAAIRASVARQKNGPTPAQSRAIANCESALARISEWEGRGREITFIDRERLMIAADRAPSPAARDHARRLLDRNPPRLQAAEARRFGL